VGSLVAVFAALAVAPPVATLHSGQREWFMPGRLQVGSSVVCIAHGRRLTLKVAATGSDAVWAWNGASARGSVSLHPNGAAEVDCDVESAPPRIAAGTRYVVGRNGLGLLRGVNTRARLERLYGPGTAAGCALVWPRIGLRASFASCKADAALTRAIVTGPRWSTLDGVHVGDSIARMLWQDTGAKRVHGAWILGGVGVQRLPRLVAIVGPSGGVTAFEIVAR
jgi:hypothetical protein